MGEITRAESIKTLNELIDYIWSTCPTQMASVYCEALKIAIKALDQEGKEEEI